MKDRITRLENYVRTDIEKPEEEPLCVEFNIPKKAFHQHFDITLPAISLWHELEQSERDSLVHSMFYTNEILPKDKHHGNYSI